MLDGEKFGARFLVITASSKVLPKEKFFDSAAARSMYLDKLSDAGNLYEVIAYLDPKHNEGAVKK